MSPVARTQSPGGARNGSVSQWRLSAFKALQQERKESLTKGEIHILRELTYKKEAIDLFLYSIRPVRYSSSPLAQDSSLYLLALVSSAAGEDSFRGNADLSVGAESSRRCRLLFLFLRAIEENST